jgi:hypothetical protein
MRKGKLFYFFWAYFWFYHLVFYIAVKIEAMQEKNMKELMCNYCFYIIKGQ